MQLPEGKKIYFASDFHLGIPDLETSHQRERFLCQWLDAIAGDAAIIYLVGDIFDVWFEYKHVVPKGYVRFLGKLAALTDSGIKIEAFTGNHDLWMQDYFEKELHIPVHHDNITFDANGKSFFLGHGDGIGPGDRKYKFMKKIMVSPVAQWVYRKIHPDTGMGIANYFSRRGAKSRLEDHEFYGEAKEWQILFARECLKHHYYNYFIFGHRHYAYELPLGNGSYYYNLGDWLYYFTYGVFDGVSFELKTYEPAFKYFRKNG